MEVTLPADLTGELQQRVAAGQYESADALISQAIRQLFDAERRGQARLNALRRVGKAVDEAGLYDRALLPDPPSVS
jgi:Arc/MetJ-type ribon-helix-helix transcriptional regulator